PGCRPRPLPGCTGEDQRPGMGSCATARVSPRGWRLSGTTVRWPCSCLRVGLATLPGRGGMVLTGGRLGVLGRGIDPGLLALGRGDRGRRTGQRVVATTGLREGDDVADRGGPGQRSHDTVPAEGDTAVRRSPVSERLQHETELLPGLLLGYPHDGEDPLLHVPPVDTDGPATDLVAV